MPLTSLQQPEDLTANRYPPRGAATGGTAERDGPGLPDAVLDALPSFVEAYVFENRPQPFVALNTAFLPFAVVILLRGPER
jgi:hypothetical protein